MDSLSQIVLGAAVGEVVLGKKIGNRAMVWGAVAGTIPDLDVLGKFFLSNIDNLAFHRGISHSISFCIVGAFVFGWLVHRLYQSKYHKWVATISKITAAVLVVSALDFVFQRFNPGSYTRTIGVGIVLAGLAFWNIKRNYFSGKWEAPKADLRDWQWLFFWSLITHPLLDCFTMYGTQLFAPFSDYRVAWSTVSVADPMYTLPFLICVVVASFLHRESKKRRVWNYVGLGLSCSYLLFTVINKKHVNSVFEDSMKRQGMEVERYISNASILNNVLWSLTAETKDAYYIAQYSLFDEVAVRFNKVEKNHHLLHDLTNDHTLKTLTWFSDNYFTVTDVGAGQYQFSDLRFGTFKGKGDSPDDFIFRFLLTDLGENGYQMEEAVGGPPEGGAGSLVGDLWARIKGLKE